MISLRERAAVFIIRDKKLLLLKRCRDNNEYYAVPGGGVEEGENIYEAAIRELREETTLEVTLGEMIGTLTFGNNKEYFFLAKDFHGTPKLSGPEAQRNSPNNVYELKWVQLKEIENVNLRKEIKDLLKNKIPTA